MSEGAKTMRAVAIDDFGEVDELEVKHLPVPEPGPDEVLIQIESIGVGAWDPYEISGGFHQEGMAGEPSFPYVPGADCAGTVAAVGQNVDRFEPGQRVYAFTLVNPKGGSYAEYVAVNQELVSPIPEGIGTREAGVLPTDAMTALRGLDDTLGVTQGETVMIFGASGGVGHFAVQIAKRMGARVFAVASGKDGVQLAARLGADAAVDGREKDVASAARAFAPDGIDAALVTAGGSATDAALEAVKRGGRVAYPHGVMPEPRERSGLRIHGYDGVPDREAIGKLNRLIEHDSFEVAIDRTFALRDAPAALHAVAEHHLGKFALAPS